MAVVALIVTIVGILIRIVVAYYSKLSAENATLAAQKQTETVVKNVLQMVINDEGYRTAIRKTAKQEASDAISDLVKRHFIFREAETLKLINGVIDASLDELLTERNYREVLRKKITDEEKVAIKEATDSVVQKFNLEVREINLMSTGTKLFDHDNLCTSKRAVIEVCTRQVLANITQKSSPAIDKLVLEICSEKLFKEQIEIAMDSHLKMLQGRKGLFSLNTGLSNSFADQESKDTRLASDFESEFSRS